MKNKGAARRRVVWTPSRLLLQAFHTCALDGEAAVATRTITNSIQHVGNRNSNLTSGGVVAIG
jgi:hypothetical protein